MVDALRASREAIEKYNRELEDKVELRTAQLRETNAAIKDMQEKLCKRLLCLQWAKLLAKRLTNS